MKEAILTIILVLTTITLAICQDGKFSYSPPKDFILLDSASGDLNRDGKIDYVVVLKSILEDSDHEKQRPLIILITNSRNKLEQIARNDNVVLCRGCGGAFGDPYQGISIKSNYFSIDHYGGSAWRWTRNITFKYIQSLNRFVLHKDGGDSFHATDPETVNSYFKNRKDFGRLPFTRYRNDKEDD